MADDRALDRRLTAARPDLAATALRGIVVASRYVDPVPMQVTAPLLDLTCGVMRDGALDSQLIHGQTVAMYEDDPVTGLAWVQAEADGYVGYVPRAGLSPRGPAATHRVATLGAQVYARPSLKLTPLLMLPYQAEVTVLASADGYGQIGPDRWIALAQLTDTLAQDPVAEAQRLTGVPYVWGGRSHAGLDCSALIQLAFGACGHSLPRDSDMQADLGTPVTGPPGRGDLVFWKGHVGIMRDGDTLLHANAHHMAVTSEPFAQAKARISSTSTGPVTTVRRLDL